jgi:hypothetical protein
VEAGKRIFTKNWKLFDDLSDKCGRDGRHQHHQPFMSSMDHAARPDAGAGGTIDANASFKRASIL